MSVSYWCIGRVACRVCAVVRTVVKHPDAIVTCPTCGAACVAVCGLDDDDTVQ